MKRTSTWM